MRENNKENYSLVRDNVKPHFFWGWGIYEIEND